MILSLETRWLEKPVIRAPSMGDSRLNQFLMDQYLNLDFKVHDQLKSRFLAYLNQFEQTRIGSNWLSSNRFRSCFPCSPPLNLQRKSIYSSSLRCHIDLTASRSRSWSITSLRNDFSFLKPLLSDRNWKKMSMGSNLSRSKQDGEGHVGNFRRCLSKAKLAFKWSLWALALPRLG